MRPRFSPTLLVIALTTTTLIQPCTSQSKRGLSYHTPTGGDRHDYDLFFSSNSSISWYYNWSPYPSGSPPDSVEFIPLIHGLSDLPSDISTVKSIPAPKSQPRMLLTFNEPDGSTESGGSDISPSDAAEAYINSILPLRHTSSSSKPNSGFLLSHPSVTGTGSGLNWLKSFNESCYALNPVNGCPSDFIAVHFYGDFPALASWLGTLHEWYSDASLSQGQELKLWVTEFALPQFDANTTLRMMNQSISYMDSLEYVAGYAWFGLFRADEANAWTGPGVALVDDNGGLSSLGALYLGGEDRGFSVGEKSNGKGDSSSSTSGVNNDWKGRGEEGRKSVFAFIVAVAVALILSLWSYS